MTEAQQDLFSGTEDSAPRIDASIEKSKNELSPETREHLSKQLIRLGDMMGDGMHHEPGGSWISKEYRRVAKALGYIPPAKRDVDGINQRVANAISKFTCLKCQGGLRQTRSGSLAVQCVSCGNRMKLSASKKKKA